jgi:hypothetical protein
MKLELGLDHGDDKLDRLGVAGKDIGLLIEIEQEHHNVSSDLMILQRHLIQYFCQIHGRVVERVAIKKLPGNKFIHNAHIFVVHFIGVSPFAGNTFLEPFAGNGLKQVRQRPKGTEFHRYAFSAIGHYAHIHADNIISHGLIDDRLAWGRVANQLHEVVVVDEMKDVGHFNFLQVAGWISERLDKVMHKVLGHGQLWDGESAE